MLAKQTTLLTPKYLLQYEQEISGNERNYGKTFAGIFQNKPSNILLDMEPNAAIILSLFMVVVGVLACGKYVAHRCIHKYQLLKQHKYSSFGIIRL